MDIKDWLQIRDFRTHNIIGFLNRHGPQIAIPKEGQFASFLVDYKALQNHDMGQAVEIFDPEQDKVTEFVVLHEFKLYDETMLAETSIYYVSKFTVSNLDMLEFVHYYNEKERKVDTK